MNTNTMIKPATDDEIRTWLQGEIQDSLQGNGVDWLETTVELAVEETLERPEAPAADQAETMAGARRHIARASRAAAERDWSEVASSIYWLTVELYWCLPGAPGSRSRELQHAIDCLYDAATAAGLKPWSPDWRAWRGDTYCSILLDQPWYSDQGLADALHAWQRGADLTINGGRLEIIETEAE